MRVLSAQAVADKGKVTLIVAANVPVFAVQWVYSYTQQVPVEVEEDDGTGRKVRKTVMKPVEKQGTRMVVTKYRVEMKQYLVTGNDRLTLLDATGKKLSDDDVLKTLENPAFILECTEEPDADFLKTLKPDTVALARKPQQPRPAAPVAPK